MWPRSQTSGLMSGSLDALELAVERWATSASVRSRTASSVLASPSPVAVSVGIPVSPRLSAGSRRYTLPNCSWRAQR